jgi:protein TonB
MFEQVLIESPGLLKRPLAVTISFTGQAAVAATAIMLSLIHSDSLPRPLFLAPLMAPGTRARHISPTRTASVVRSAKGPWHVFTAPAAIPARVISAQAEPLLLAGDDAVIDMQGLAGGIVPTGQSLDTIGILPRPPVRPPSQPKEQPPETPAASIPKKPVAVSQGVQAAKLIRQVQPAYPALARQARISGSVRLTAIIGRDGAIRNLEVMSGHPLLTAAALEAVKQWVYQPTLLNREPVEVVTRIDVNFTLSR